MYFKIFISITIIITLGLLAYTCYLQSVVFDRVEKQQKYSVNLQSYFDTLSKFTESYNEIYDSYNKLSKKYFDLKYSDYYFRQSGLWETFTVTAYTSLDDGCNSISSTNIDIEKLSKYFNLCAVDPKVIPYGSVVLIKFETDIVPFLAIDCGSLVKGKRLDLYFVNDQKKATEFGVKKMEVLVLKNEKENL